MVPVSLRSAPLEAEVTIPDGRTVRVRIGVADDSYIPQRELDTVTVELYANGEHVAAVTTVLDAKQTREATIPVKYAALLNAEILLMP